MAAGRPERSDVGRPRVASAHRRRCRRVACQRPGIRHPVTKPRPSRAGAIPSRIFVSDDDDDDVAARASQSRHGRRRPACRSSRRDEGGVVGLPARTTRRCRARTINRALPVRLDDPMTQLRAHASSASPRRRRLRTRLIPPGVRSSLARRAAGRSARQQVPHHDGHQACPPRRHGLVAGERPFSGRRKKMNPNASDLGTPIRRGDLAAARARRIEGHLRSNYDGRRSSGSSSRWTHAQETIGRTAAFRSS